MKEQGSSYLVYLLQLWRADDGVRREGAMLAGWRASLTDPETRECRRFSSLSEMFTFIEEEVSDRANASKRVRE